MGTEPQPVRWQVFGEVDAIGTEPGPALGTRSRAVLALLLLNAGDTLRPESLADGLWADEHPKTARNSIQRFVADIRRRLGPAASRLVTNTDGYAITVLDDELDLHRARDALARGRALLVDGNPDHALEALADGLVETQGIPLGGVGTAEMYTTAVLPLEELSAALTISHFEAALALGRHAVVGAQISEHASKNPHSEHAWALHMLSLYRSGRQQDALDAAEVLRKRLLDDLGVTPSPPIAKLTHQILNHADELQLIERSISPLGSAATTRVDGDLPIQLERAQQTAIAGRDGPLTRAEEALADLEAGRPRITLVCGNPGIGKTRLAAAFAARVVDRGGLTLYGRSDEDTSLPLGAWAEALAPAVQTGGQHLVEALTAAERDSLSTILPGFDQSPTPSDVADYAIQVTAELRRSLLFQAVSHLLGALASTNPLLVVLDDLQWADTATIQLLRHVARHATGAVWIVAAYRDNEASRQPILPDAIATLLAEAHVQREELGGITHEAIAELVQSLLPEVNEARLPDFAQALQSETAGNPFFAREIVRDLIEDDPGQLTVHLDVASASPVTLPASIRDVLRHRALRLGKSTANILRHASIFGRGFGLEELATISGEQSRTVSDALQAAMNAGLLADGTEDVDRFAFAHDLIHHSLYQDLGTLDRRRLHGLAADAIAAATRTSLEASDRALEVAGHLLEAKNPQRARQTIEAIESAAAVANERHAPAEAAQLHERGIELLSVAGFARELDGVERMRLHMIVHRGIELRNAGDPGYREALLDAGRHARELGDTEAEVQAALANTRGVQTHVWDVDRARVEQLRSALGALGREESVRRADLLASLASELWGDDDRAEAAALRGDSIDLARRLGDRAALANALSRAARARNADISNDDMRLFADELESLVQHTDEFDPYLAVTVLRAMQNQALRDADPDRLFAMSAAIRLLTESTQLPICHRSDVLSDVLIAGLRGQGERYLTLAEEALNISIDMGDPESFIAYEGHYLVGMDMLGRAEEVLPLIASVAADRPADVYQAVIATGHAKCGDVPAAHEVLDAALVRGIASGVDDYTIQALQLWADAAGLTDHLPACQMLYPMLAPHSGRLSGHVVLCIQPVDLSLGRVAHVLGNFEKALAHFDISDRICEAFEANWMQGMTDVSRARTLVRLGDRDVACELLDQAIGRARTHRHPGVERDAIALLEQIDATTHGEL